MQRRLLLWGISLRCFAAGSADLLKYGSADQTFRRAKTLFPRGGAARLLFGLS